MSTVYPLLSRNTLQRPLKRVHKSGDNVFVKHGTPHEVQREVEAIEFVRRRTSIPIPSIIELHVSENDSWFSMNLIPGSPLTDAWTDMTEAAKQTTQKDLYNYLKELRAIPPPIPAYIGSCTGGPAFDHRLNNGLPCGPFTSESDFNGFLIAPVRRCPRQELVVYYLGQLVNNHKIVFTHADLCGDHVLIEPTTGKITGIIDWEMAGWWPDYWEYTKSLFGNKYEPWWTTLVPKVLHPYRHELQIERALQEF